jgi:hypothetical protein
MMNAVVLACTGSRNHLFVSKTSRRLPNIIGEWSRIVDTFHQLMDTYNPYLHTDTIEMISKITHRGSPPTPIKAEITPEQIYQRLHAELLVAKVTGE